MAEDLNPSIQQEASRKPIKHYLQRVWNQPERRWKYIVTKLYANGDKINVGVGSKEAMERYKLRLDVKANLVRDELVEEIVKVEVALQKYAHSARCKFYVECPATHDTCKKRLGLDTSIAWDLAYHISTLYESKKLIQEDLKTKVGQIDYLTTALSNIVNRHGYTKLRALIKQVKSVLELLKCIQE